VCDIITRGDAILHRANIFICKILVISFIFIISYLHMIHDFTLLIILKRNTQKCYINFCYSKVCAVIYRLKLLINL
jgi:hypothetical protein